MNPLFPNIKFLKVVLPITTLTAATVITATLLFSKKEDIKLTNLNEEALDNYDKELEPYKEEIKAEQADEASDQKKEETDDKSKEKNESAGPQNKDKVDQGPEKKKSLHDLFKEKLDSYDGKEGFRKLLEDPEQLVKDLLQGEGTEPPSEGEKEQFLKEAKEIVEQLELDKQKGEVSTGDNSQDPEGETEASRQPSKAEEKVSPPEGSDVPKPATENKAPKEGEMLEEKDISEITRDEELPKVQEAEPQSDSVGEVRSESGEDELDEDNSLKASDQMPDKEVEGDLKDNATRRDEGEEYEEEQNSLREKNTEGVGDQEVNNGGNAEETKYAIQALTSLKGQLRGAIASLLPKLV